MIAVEQFRLANISIEALAPAEHPDLPVAQVALMLVGVPAIAGVEAAKTYMTFLVPSAARELGPGLVQAADEAESAAPARGLVAATVADMRAVTEQADRVDQLRGG